MSGKHLAFTNKSYEKSDIHGHRQRGAAGFSYLVLIKKRKA